MLQISFSAIPISSQLASLHNRRAFFKRANASVKRVRRAIKGYVWGGMQKNNVCEQAVVFSASSLSRLSGASHSLRACLRSPAKTQKK